jgi:hypothetical protein
MEKLKELQDLAIWMTGCGYDFTQHEHFLKNKHLLTDEAINYTHSCTELNIADNKPIFNEGYRLGWREGYQEGNSDI